eukprot:jgi/Ulvmu1/6765/UM030_0101.1
MPAAFDDFNRTASVGLARTSTGLQLPTLAQCGSRVGSLKAGVEVSRYCDSPSDMPEGIAEAFKVAQIVDGGLRSVREHGRELVQEHALDDNFLVVDLGRIHRLYQAFVESMPRVRPFYAVKCNPHSGIVRAMAVLGCGFDCASAPEMQAALAAGATPADMILAHPCKRPVDLRFAAHSDVLRMTVDCEDELDKIAECMPHAELVLRIRADDPTAIVSFGCKYGADADGEAPALLAAAKRRKLTVVGVSFHVGSGSQAPESYRHAIQAARQVFDAAKAQGFHMTLLDIGGGFCGSFDKAGNVVMGDVAVHINNALADYFPLSHYGDVAMIAEPGRYFIEACATMFIMTHTVKSRPDGRQWYYLTDGLHGSLAEIPSGRRSTKAHVMRSPALPRPSEAECAARVPSTVFGPTLDGWDRILEDVPMPVLRRGDWLLLPDHGAYSTSLSTAFNGFAPSQARTFYTWSHTPADTEAGAVVALHKGTASDSPDLQAPEELTCLTATPKDLGITCIHAHA